MLAEAGEMDGDPRPITHPVKFFEKGDKPLEIVSSRQWYIRNGGRDDDLRQALIDRGDEMNWVPSYMQTRYTSWIEGLNGDWLISRQRFFGVPIPLWYPLDAAGEPVWDQPMIPSEDQLPIDPSTDVPAGYDEAQPARPAASWANPTSWTPGRRRRSRRRSRPAGEPTRTSTPAPSRWTSVHRRTTSSGPGCSRPLSGRTSMLTTSRGRTALSGWILDPDRKKMSKSKGNVVVPTELLEQYGSDAVRYWASSGRPGTDTAFDEGQMKIGRRLSIKLLNASKFVLGFGDTSEGIDPSKVTDALDQSMLDRLGDLVDEATAAFDGFDYARSLERTESFFWWFTDNYMELVKARAYGEYGDERGVGSSRAAHGAVDTASALRPIPALRHRRGLELVAGRIDPSRRMAHRCRAARASRWYR